MKIDNSKEISKDRVLDNFIIEAEIYDTASWYDQEGYMDLLSSKAANIRLNPSPTRLLGFHGYVLSGKLETPRLWSAEQVRNLSYQLIFFSSVCHLFYLAQQRGSMSSIYF